MWKSGATAFVTAGLCLFLSSAYGADPAAKTGAADPQTDVAAKFGSETISLKEIDEKILKTNMKLAQDLYNARKAAIDQIVMERVLGPDAKAKNVTVDQLIKEKVTEKVQPVTDADVSAYFESNKGRMGGKTLEQVSGQIKQQLTGQRENSAREALIKELKEKAQVKVTLDAPRANVTVAANDPVKGPATAKVTIVEFSEFQ